MNSRLSSVIATTASVLLLACPSVRAQAPEASLSAVLNYLSEVNDDATRLDILRGVKAGLSGRRNVAMPKEWPALEQSLAKSPQQEVRLLAQNLGLTFGSQFALTSLRDTLKNPKAETAVRRSALEGLVSIKDPELPALLRPLLKEGALRPEAIRALALFNDPSTPEALLAVYGTLSLAERRDTLNTLASRLTYARPLIAAVSSGRVPKNHLTAELVRQIRSLKDNTLNQELQKTWGLARETSADKRQEIDRYRKIYAAGGSTPGDASRGRKVFARVCQQCHTLFDTGGKVGPDLTGSNRADLDYILSNIVDPNAVIPNDYRSSTVETKDDRVLTGIIQRQDDKSLTIVTANEVVVLPKSEVRSQQLSELSMMPEGLLTALTDTEIRDLIYYLGRPGQVP